MVREYYGKIHPTCLGCQWEAFPLCNGTLLGTEKMRIDSMRPSFKCGVKDLPSPVQNKIEPEKTADQIKIEDLEARILTLESK